MNFPLDKVNIDIQFYLLEKRWLKYWIETRLNYIQGLSLSQPCSFETWWERQESFSLPFNIDYPQ